MSGAAVAWREAAKLCQHTVACVRRGRPAAEMSEDDRRQVAYAEGCSLAYSFACLLAARDDFESCMRGLARGVSESCRHDWVLLNAGGEQLCLCDAARALVERLIVERGRAEVAK